jgi:ADP-ribose pyrophosphatase YjhB (NUDIX family)
MIRPVPSAIYKEFLRRMPVACVDLIVLDEHKRILMLKRRNRPCRGEWWFPGGRIHLKETRLAAVSRKLREECGLKLKKAEEIGTYDYLFRGKPNIFYSVHGVTTVYKVSFLGGSKMVLDRQSDAYSWHPASYWAKRSHPFICKALKDAELL